ncbi:hypothetical protein O181_047206 [Austropuccinia psidii MF-1]|uniref:Uncharacterized protein n=1 Tax=Austropuccinia psidii MF-1 TaxID=1389203 RepID=A0A9Q3HJB1_9BASI|nr:hypothetical protein [Austropuccinia psidii MF-1]
MLKMLSQRNLQLVQSLKSHNKDATRSTKKADCFSSSCEFDQMRCYDAFDSPGELEAFEGVFGFETSLFQGKRPSLVRYLISTYGLNTMGLKMMWDMTINENGDDSEWDPAQVFFKNKEVQ